tara:strand:+ start:302 stop:916 length:615 start_codon:yes stop_codon:yes gene_type:complete
MARDVKFLVSDVKKAVASGGQSASVLIMNSLSQKGPQWTGRFSSAWSSVSGRTKRGSGPRQSEGPKFTYKLNDVKKAVIPKSVSGVYNLYTILNESPYAKIALDLDYWIPGQLGVNFDLPFGSEKSTRFTFGTRPRPGKRGQLTNESKTRPRDFDIDNSKGLQNSRSADLDWYSNYASGGAFAKDFKAGIRSGLKSVSRNPGNA